MGVQQICGSIKKQTTVTQPKVSSLLTLQTFTLLLTRLDSAVIYYCPPVNVTMHSQYTIIAEIRQIRPMLDQLCYTIYNILYSVCILC